MKTVMTIVGARPQFVKAAPVSRELRKRCREVLVHTGQHYDYSMAGVFFEELEIPKPDYDLGIGSSSHGRQTGEMLISLEALMLETVPDAVLVYGDTNSTLAGALAASKLRIPLFHVEAGLRSYNRDMPEEINRVMTDHVSALLFAPTAAAVSNLRAERVTEGVYEVGDVMYDAVLYNERLAAGKHRPEDFGVSAGGYYLATIHRPSNTDDPVRLRAILQALRSLDYPVLFPLHPRTGKMLEAMGESAERPSGGNLLFTEPLSYLEMLALERQAKAIITDSGGVQKEAYFAKVPCFTLRPETEWVETVDCGWNTLVDPLTMDLGRMIGDYRPGSYIENLYGDGTASLQIAELIQQFHQ
ncbi:MULTISPECIES: non-hydrolyzing UDP-N-acetylglucosamine 2-epimerase [Paenibacillus]|uniref:non-hydrolyzing UDP-N-acetylglucosamine 2-epimerase n=1 Tax=Paenibacillus TaxID=44249 RepID=UPI002FE25FD0